MHPDSESSPCVVLSNNSGSSSLKFGLYRLAEAQEVQIAHGAVENIGLSSGHLWIRGIGKTSLVDIQRKFPDHAAAAEGIFAATRDLSFPSPEAAGHRVVHGGARHVAPERVDAQLLEDLRSLAPFAMLHLPSAIQGIEAVAARFPGLPQVACFDTAFHHGMPKVAQLFPLPRDLWHEGIRRYGFHGLSYEYIVATLGAAGHGRLVIAHLGNGASLVAVLDRNPVDTTMGFTPTGGLMMETRSGDLDPGLLTYLMNAKKYNAHQIEDLVNEKAGLLGVSGVSPDMKTLVEQREREPNANEAIELYCYLLRKQVAAMASVLGGIDTLVFTGGIGEHAAPVRWEVCRGLSFLGIHLDPDRNADNADVISTTRSACVVRVIPTNENLMVARHTRRVLATKAQL
jgi:acetate kinase